MNACTREQAEERGDGFSASLEGKHVLRMQARSCRWSCLPAFWLLPFFHDVSSRQRGKSALSIYKLPSFSDLCVLRLVLAVQVLLASAFVKAWSFLLENALFLLES